MYGFCAWMTLNISSVIFYFSKTVKPTFLQTLSNHTCRDGESVTLTCEVHGDPRPQIAWYKDGEEILDSQVSNTAFSGLTETWMM